MKRVTYIILAAAALAVLGSLNLQAQAPAASIAFINSQQAIDAHPSGASARDIEQRGIAEITEIQTSLNAIIERAQSGATITPEEQEAFQTGQIALESTAQRYQQEVAAAAEPAVVAVDTALKAVAAEQGYTVVIDYLVARESGLVVYAQEGLDITELVISRMQ